LQGKQTTQIDTRLAAVDQELLDACGETLAELRELDGPKDPLIEKDKATIEEMDDERKDGEKTFV
jgi:hypothetical protein